MNVHVPHHHTMRAHERLCLEEPPSPWKHTLENCGVKCSSLFEGEIPADVSCNHDGFWTASTPLQWIRWSRLLWASHRREQSSPWVDIGSVFSVKRTVSYSSYACGCCSQPWAWQADVVEPGTSATEECIGYVSPTGFKGGKFVVRPASTKKDDAHPCTAHLCRS